MYELQRITYRLQDLANRSSIPTARLAQLTFNINRGEGVPPLESYSSFLPYPSRFEALQQLEKTENISKAAAKDFAKYFHKLTHTQKQAFESIKLGLFDKAKN